MSHGIRQISEDTSNKYYESEHGIKVVPHHQKWIGYYRLGAGYGKWELILIAFCMGKAPGKLGISIRSYDDLAKATGQEVQS